MRRRRQRIFEERVKEYRRSRHRHGLRAGQQTGKDGGQKIKVPIVTVTELKNRETEG